MNDPHDEGPAAEASNPPAPDPHKSGLEATLAPNDPHEEAARELLRLRREAHPHANPPPSPAAEAEMARLKPEEPGDRVDSYELIEEIGRGSFGVVWLAEQLEPVRRRVALKIVKVGMDTHEMIARFEQERQALALMDHPNIAKVFDAGATPTGRPFFVMELVGGAPITSFCDAEKLPVRERLCLFVQVCEAIQHAHQKGIIHRDIKPSNILVARGDDGEPAAKVIDFGVAKATGGKLTDKTLFTELEQMIGTPAYMSPEQAGAAGGIDTRSDIYALGAVLYELLTGQMPFDPTVLREAGYDEMRRIIREDEPPRPSTRLGTLARADSTTIAESRSAELPTLITSIRRELDWVVMKALEKDRARRYESASGLARDVERFLNDEPVAARPPSQAYRMAKFARRHRLAVAASIAIAAAMITGTSISVWQAARATTARNDEHQRKLEADAEKDRAITARTEADAQKEKALAARGEAEKILELLLDDFRVEFEGRADLPIFKKVEKMVDDYYEKLGVDEANPSQMRRRAWAYSNRGDTRMQEQDLPAAEAAYNEALAIMQRIVARDPANPDWQRDLAVAHQYLGNFRYSTRNPKGALENFEQCVAIVTRLVEAHPDNENYDGELSNSLDGRGKVRTALGDAKGAGEDFTRALVIRESWVQKRPKSGHWARNLSRSQKALANYREAQGDAAGAIALMDKAVTIRIGLAQSNPANAEFQFELASAYIDFALLQSKTGDHTAASRSIEHASEIAKDLDKVDQGNPEFRHRTSGLQRKLGELRQGKGDLAGAEDSLLKILTARTRAAEEKPDDLQARRGMAVALSNVGQVREERGNLADAVEPSTRALEIMQTLVKAQPDESSWQRELALSNLQLSSIRRKQGDLAAADSLVTRGLEMISTLMTANPQSVEFQCDLANAHGALGSLRKQQNRLPEAIAAYEKILEILEPLKNAGTLPEPFEQFRRQARDKLEAVKRQ